MLNVTESSSINFKCHRTIEFDRSFRKLDNNIQRILDKTIQEVLFTQPYESKRLVAPENRGKRCIRKGNYRLIFGICRECREIGAVRLNNCIDCRNRGENDIMLFVCGHRKHVYDE